MTVLPAVDKASDARDTPQEGQSVSADVLLVAGDVCARLVWLKTSRLMAMSTGRNRNFFDIASGLASADVFCL